MEEETNTQDELNIKEIMKPLKFKNKHEREEVYFMLYTLNLSIKETGIKASEEEIKERINSGRLSYAEKEEEYKDEDYLNKLKKKRLKE